MGPGTILNNESSPYKKAKWGLAPFFYKKCPYRRIINSLRIRWD